MLRFLLLLPLLAMVNLKPVRQTARVSDDADDPAIWVNLQDPAQSLILGTNKVQAPHGALYVFGLDGKVRQRIPNINRPNNVDVEYGLDGIDIAVVTERLTNRLRVFRVQASGLTDLGAVDCCPEPMGIGLYKRPRDGVIFAIVAPKGRPTSPRQNYLCQYRLQREGNKVTGKLVRRFGKFSGTKEIEAIVVDDAVGAVYYADEGVGIRKYPADPEHPQADQELSLFGTSGYRGDREGLAIYARPDGSGYLVSTDQLPGNSEYHVFDRQGGNSKQFVFRGGADTTDGIEITAAPLGPEFPAGLFVAMNSRGQNFLLYDARAIVQQPEAASGGSRRRSHHTPIQFAEKLRLIAPTWHHFHEELEKHLTLRPLLDLDACPRADLFDHLAALANHDLLLARALDDDARVNAHQLLALFPLLY